MSKYIFFDLETTDLNFTGQILQFSFVLTDENYNKLDCLNGTVALSRTQLPNPGAIDATNIDINDHLELKEEHEELEPNGIFLNNFSERDSLNIIQEWLSEKCIKEKVYLIGHNSTNFDVPFLRTSMIRNGINPYFNGNLEYLDTKNILKRLYCENKDFENLIKSGNLSRPFSLENICNLLNLLEGKTQTHQADDDVDLLIEMSKKISDMYDFDIKNSSCVVDQKNKKDKLAYKNLFYFDYEELEDGNVKLKGTKKIPVILYDRVSAGRYYFFLDVNKALESYNKNKTYTLDDARKLLIWKKTSGAFLYVKENESEYSEKDEKKLKSVIEKLKKLDISISNYFEDKICDVEQHIYMVDFNSITKLNQAITEFEDIGKPLTKLPDIHSERLFNRFLLNNKKEIDENFKKVFLKYLHYRYGRESSNNGIKHKKMVINKFLTVSSPKIEEDDYHETLNSYLKQIHLMLNKYEDKEKIKILINLLNYYFKVQIEYNFN